MARPRDAATSKNERTWEAFEQYLWKAVERGSVTAMKLWSDLHRVDPDPESAEDAALLEFIPRERSGK
jgi:hypothetical protein